MPVFFLTVLLVYLSFISAPTSNRYDGPNGLVIYGVFWTGLPVLAGVAGAMAVVFTPRYPINKLDRFAPAFTAAIGAALILFAVLGLGLLPT